MWPSPPCPALPPSSISDLVKTTTSILAIPLAVITFWLGYRQRERERTRGYYHKVVVDVVLPSILSGINVEIDRLREAGRLALAGMASRRKTLPRETSLALSDFTTELFKLQDTITERTLIFDEGVTNAIRADFEALEDNVKTWFGDVVVQKRRNLEEIENMLRSSQRTIIKRLYRGEFRDF